MTRIGRLVATYILEEPYDSAVFPEWVLNFLACLGVLGIVGGVFLLALWLAR
jgi:hypothetical protein